MKVDLDIFGVVMTLLFFIGGYYLVNHSHEVIGGLCLLASCLFALVLLARNFKPAE